MIARSNDPVQLYAEANLSHDGRGVIKYQDKTYFVDGVLAGEKIIFTPYGKRRGQYTGRLDAIIEPSRDRVEPTCEYFGVCGGCALQHLAPEAQIHFKAKTLKENLIRIGHVEPQTWLEPLSGAFWHYRRKARPGVKFVPKKGGVIIGFRERGERYITPLNYCLTLDKNISDLLPQLRTLFAGSSICNQIPQLEVAAADNAIAIIVRHLAPFSEMDLASMEAFAKQHNVQLYLQAGGPQTILPLYPQNPLPLYYKLPDYQLKLEFLPSDFLQVNARVNEKMIALAISLLALKEGDAVLDLFCGLGNFSLAIAASGMNVMGVEGEASLVARAEHNAKLNKLANIRFGCANLHLEDSVKKLPAKAFNKLVLDPPRSGAQLIVTDYVPVLMPDTIVYVSCNPATLARDADILVHQHGYTLLKAGAIDMFPHTAHVESIALFRRKAI